MKEHQISTPAIQQWVQNLFLAAGSDAGEAQITAQNLVLANLSGHDSHGIGLVPRYVKSFLGGELKLNQTIELAVDTGPMVIADCGMGMGQSVGTQAMDVAIQRASEHGVALLGLRNAHHIGRIGHWAEQAINAGMVSIHFVNATIKKPVVAPHGGSEARFLTNPFTVGIPRRDGDPLVLDFATSAIAHGKARVALNKGVGVPEGTTIDADGNPTTDPRVLYDDPLGAIRTFAAHKGHALAIVCELLGGALTGGRTTHPASLPEGLGIVNNMLSIVFDPARLGTQDNFESETQLFIDWVQSARLDEIGRELGGILLPGDPERRMRAARAKHLPVDQGTMDELSEAAREISAYSGKTVADPSDLIAP
ncbi:MAG: malate/lactate/ureidoglycolate dehydrogenase [Burkholderiaceae bacterium]